MNYYVYRYRNEDKIGIWRDSHDTGNIVLDTILSNISASEFNSWDIPPYFLEGIGWRMVYQTENLQEAIGCACIEMV